MNFLLHNRGNLKPAIPLYSPNSLFLIMAAVKEKQDRVGISQTLLEKLFITGPLEDHFYKITRQSRNYSRSNAFYFHSHENNEGTII